MIKVSYLPERKPNAKDNGYEKERNNTDDFVWFPPDFLHPPLTAVVERDDLPRHIDLLLRVAIGTAHAGRPNCGEDVLGRSQFRSENRSPPSMPAA